MGARVTTIAITGVGGLLGRQLVSALDARADVERIVGLDVRRPIGLMSPKLVFRHADVRDPDIVEPLRGADVLIHLAFQMDPIHDEAVMRAINVDGTRNVLEAARAAAVRHVVYPSSVVAYGAHPDNDLPLTEDSPLRGTPGFNYSEHERDVEVWLGPWSETADDLDVTVLRLALVLGPGVQNFMTRVLEAPRLLLVKGHKPPLQFVHLDDVVSAILHVLDRQLVGVFNVSAEGWLSMDEVTAIVGRRSLQIPEEVAFSTAERLWALGLGEQPPGLVHHLMYPWVMTPAKLVATGWAPQHSNRDALDEAAREHRPYVAVLGLRARRRTVRTVSVAAASVAGYAAFRAARAAGRAWRRRAEERRLDS
jgi:nucleoside-diphosphate-sugar epimerase